MERRIKVIVYLYNRLLDPLIQGNIFLYINELTQRSERCPYEFTIITYEDDQYPISESDKQIILEDFSKRYIHWIPLKWHPGTSPLQKGIDLVAGMRAVYYLRLNGYKHLISLGSVAGSLAYLFCGLFRIKLFLYQYEPHSEFNVDNGVWKSSSFSFRSLNFIEKKSAIFANVISTGTSYMLSRLESWKIKGSTFKIPSVVNDSIFSFKGEARKRIRASLGISEDKKVIIFAGKFGGLYYGIETLQAFKWLAESISNLFFLLLHLKVPNWSKVG